MSQSFSFKRLEHVKPVLGRNLGTLMGKSPFASATEPQNASNEPGPGVRSLLTGTPSPVVEKEADPPTEPKKEKKGNKPPLPPWYLLGADLLVTALGVILFVRTVTTAGWGARLFYMGLVLFGAILGIAAAWLANSKNDD